MFNIASIYPFTEGCRCDFDYYLEKHMPLSIERLSKAEGFHSVRVERGLALEEANIPCSYVAMCHYYFDTVEHFMAAFMPHAQELQGDIQNYTDIQPIIQINEVAIAISSEPMQ